MIYSFLLYFISYLAANDTILHTIAAYNIFMLVGFLYYKKITVGKLKFCGFLFAAITVGLFYCGYDFCPMQANKFPPNPLFVFYNLFVLCLLGVVLTKIKLNRNRWFDVYNERGFTIYLYQNMVFYVVAKLQPVLMRFNYPIIQIVITSVIVLTMSYYLSFATFKIERKVLELMKW